MQLILDQNGLHLSVDNERLAIKKGDITKYVIPGRISAIHIMTPCSLTSAVLAWTAQYDIPLLIYDNKGKVKARLWQPQFGSHAAIRLMQMEFCKSAEGIFWLKELLFKKVNQQYRLLNNLPGHLQHPQVLEKVKTQKQRLANETGLNTVWLRSLEAAASRWYWAGVAHALKAHIQIQPRKVRPAKDRFNALLNYLYGTLYGLVEGCLLAAGLDPHISIMHRMEYNTPAFVFDVIEAFRHWADEFLIDLVLNKKLHAKYTEEKKGSILITPSGKKEILTQWFAYLNQKTPAPVKHIKRKDQVQQLCSNLAAQLLKKYKTLEKHKRL